MTGRWRVLGGPWFLGAVALLAVNDHIWKQDHPGLLTGKLSDFAGVAVVAAIAAALVGRRPGLVATALGFAALKMVPGVAELAAPVLGGVTRRDPTDLFGLLALVPVWFAVGAQPPEDRVSRIGARTVRGRTTHSVSVGGSAAGLATSPLRTVGEARWRRVAGAALPIIGACTALVATTATSCSPDPAVTRVIADGSTFYAYVGSGFGSDSWARSDDAGQSWRASPAPPGVDPDAPAGIPTTSTSTTSTSTTVLSDGSSSTTTTDPGPNPRDPYDDVAIGPLRDCNRTECFRLVDGRTIQRAPLGSDDWQDEFRLTSEEAADIDTGCSGGQKGVLGSVAATDGPGGAAASLGAGGVVVRDGDGTWSRRAVLDADADQVSLAQAPAFWVVLSSVPLGMAVAWLIGRRGSALRIIGTVAVPFAMVVLVGGSLVVVAVLAQDDLRFERSQIISAGVALIIGIGLSALSRSSAPPPRELPPGWSQPPRPNPPARPSPPVR